MNCERTDKIQKDINEKKELASATLWSSKECINSAEEYEKKNNVEVSIDEMKLRKKIRNQK